MKIFHVDVFSKIPFSGNGLTVIFTENKLTCDLMQKVACEFKQFETIFLEQKRMDVYRARIFTVEEELDFAGHPILGAAAVIHKEFFPNDSKKSITMELNYKNVVTHSTKQDNYYEVVMNQGIPEWGIIIDEEGQRKYCAALNLNVENLCKKYPMEVVSTGLHYLLIPVQSGLDSARIQVNNLESLLAENGAKFVYIFDVNTMEGRTWDNLGNVEDVATGSAAGPVGAYLYKHSLYKQNEIIKINQGKHVGRPSVLKVSCKEYTGEILVSGDVVAISKGDLLI